jgi:8-oxo-dGDP phosphatase
MDELQQILHFKPSPPCIQGDPRLSDEIPNVVLKWNTCYIVCGLVVSDGKVLMIQEAKRSCRGMWYLPAGRVEQNESLEDAVRREVKEEAGLDFDPQALIAMEFQSHRWIRFTFTGRIVGGQLKTPQEEDKESIQAQWLPADVNQLTKEFPIRAGDCLKLIQIASDWYSEAPPLRYSTSIIPAPSTHMTISIILIHREG